MGKKRPRKNRQPCPEYLLPTGGRCTACGVDHDLIHLHISSTGWYRCNDAGRCREAAAFRDAKLREAAAVREEYRKRSGQASFDELGPFRSGRGLHRTKAAWDDLPHGWNWEFDEDSDALYYWHEDNPEYTTWDPPQRNRQEALGGAQGDEAASVVRVSGEPPRPEDEEEARMVAHSKQSKRPKVTGPNTIALPHPRVMLQTSQVSVLPLISAAGRPRPSCSPHLLADSGADCGGDGYVSDDVF